MRQALTDFETSLDRIRALANEIAANTGAALANGQVLQLHETQQCGAIVLLTGYFEAFLKDLVRRFISELSASGVSFGALPDSIKRRHFEGGGEVLRKASIAGRTNSTPHFGSVTREDVVARLHSVTGTGAYQIVWEAFADTRANPGPSVVTDIATSLGIDKKHFWGGVSSRCGSASKWSAATLKTSLGSLIAQRNECAHTGKVSPVPSANDILEFADMLAALATGFVGVLEAQLQSIRPPAGSTRVGASPPSGSTSPP